MIPAPPKEWPGTEDEWVAFASSMGFTPSDPRWSVDEIWQDPTAAPHVDHRSAPPPVTLATPATPATPKPVPGWLLLGAAGLLGWWFLRK
jgi:hypothetical protein